MDKEWRPNKKQVLFLSLPWSFLEAFFGGAVATGKSDVLLLYPALRGLLKEPDFKGIYFRRTFPELKNEIIPRSRSYFRQFGGTYNKNDKIWEFSNYSGLNRSRSPQGAGALFFFAHCENENDVHNYDSMQPNYAAFDELTSFLEWQYLYIALERVRRKKYSSHLPMIVRAASNPGNIGHIWVFNRFIKPRIKGLQVIIGESGIKRIYIPSTVYDNEHIDPAYLRSLEALPEAEKKAKLYGDWSAYEGQVFEEFRERHYPDEPPNAIHVIDPFDIPDWWPRIVCGDWGFAPPAGTWIGYGAIAPNKRLVVYREQYWQKTPIEIWAAQAKPYIDKERPRIINFCKSAGQDRGQEHTIQQQISDALDFPIGLSNNSPGSRVATKMLLHEYFRWRVREVPITYSAQFDSDLADWIFRNKTDYEYRRYLEQFMPPEPEENLPKVQIFKNCPLLINAIKSCSYDKNNPQDVAEFPGDDPYDGFRYLVDAADNYFEESATEFDKVRKQQALVDSLANNEIDMTMYYRNARMNELANEEVAIRRYHH
jgi:hypothetical protein